MSEINEDLKRQMAERGQALLSDFLERKPGYDGPTLTAEQEARIRDQEAAKVRAEAILAHVRELGDDY